MEDDAEACMARSFGGTLLAFDLLLLVEITTWSRSETWMTQSKLTAVSQVSSAYEL